MIHQRPTARERSSGKVNVYEEENLVKETLVRVNSTSFN